MNWIEHNAGGILVRIGVIATSILSFGVMPQTSWAVQAQPPAWRQKLQPVSYVQQRNKWLPIDQLLNLLVPDERVFIGGLDQVRSNWDIAYTPMLLDVARFLPGPSRDRVLRLLEETTKQSHGDDFDRWLQWLWNQDYQPHPEYGQFKSRLLGRIDYRFAEYFMDTKNALIRLDEIRWGGVRRDGIPPLKDPKMIAAPDASYLADTDVVFGIKLNGDARAYPKRILAWHEMFKDTIGGQSVCGVY